MNEANEVDKLLMYYFTHNELVKLIGSSKINEFITKHKIKYIVYCGMRLYPKTEVIHNIK